MDQRNIIRLLGLAQILGEAACCVNIRLANVHNAWVFRKGRTHNSDKG